MLVTPVKALLVLYYFMHLRFEKPLIQGMVLFVILSLVFAIGLTFFDYSFRQAMYSDVTTTSGALDFSFFLIVWISVVLFAGVILTMLYFVFRYSRKRNPVPVNIHGSTWLEIIWTAIPVALVLVMFYYGWVGYELTRRVPAEAMPIKVTGQMWSWTFTYPNGKSDIDLVVPVGKPIKLILSSRDVNHSFYVAAFRLKEDAIPGRENYMWFEANKTGTFDIQCTEYCGAKHSAMLAKLHIVPQAEFDTWYRTIVPGEQMAGDRLLRLRGCLSCHTTDGSAGIAPTFKALYGSKAPIVTRGKEMSMTADDDYVRESILDPNAKIVKGYRSGVMPPQAGVLNDKEIDRIIQYLKTL